MFEAKDVQSDADPDSTIYREKLLYLDGDLTQDNLKSLKFLCLDVIPAAKLEKINQGTELFEILEKLQSLGPGNLYYLAECLKKIDRVDLSNYILDSKILDMAIQKMGSTILPFRSLLFDLSEDVDTDEVAKCMYYYDKIPKSKRSLISTGVDFFSHLEQVKEIGPHKTQKIEDILCAINRYDLLEKLKMYNKQVMAEQSNNFTKDPQHMLMKRKLENDIMPDIKNDKEKIRKEETMKYVDKKTQSQQSFMDDDLLKPKSTGSLDIPTPVLIDVAYQISADPNSISQLGHHLNLTEKEINQISIKHKTRPEMKVLTMINHWTDRIDLDGDHSIDELIKIICKCHLTDIARSLANTMRRPFNVTEDMAGDAAGELPCHLAQGENQSLPHHENISVTTVEATVVQHGEISINQTQQNEEAENQVIEGIKTLSLRPLLECYSMRRSPRGFCVIINNENFRYNSEDGYSRKMNDRKGSSIDKCRLQETFSKLGFLVKTYENLSGVEMVQCLTRYSVNEDHTNFDCFVCCVLSHGTRDNVYGADGRQVPIQELTGPLKTLSCPSLVDKPKLFFIQACQGQEKQLGRDIEHDAAPVIDIDEDAPTRQVIPNESDFLLGMATIPGFVSYRSKTSGSWFIVKLCEVIDRYSNEMDILHILTQVNNEVGKANAHLEGGRYKQSPAPFYTLRKLLIFEKLV